MPVNQRLAGMLAFQIRVLRIIHVNMGHIRNIGRGQFCHGDLLCRSGIIPDHVGLFILRIDFFTGKCSECIDILFHIGDAGIYLRDNSVFSLNRICHASALQIKCQRFDGIIGRPENIPVRADIIADQANDNLIGSICSVFGESSRLYKVQNIVCDIVESID